MKVSIIKSLKENKEKGLTLKKLKEVCISENEDFSEDQFDKTIEKLTKKEKVIFDGKYLKFQKKRKIESADDDNDAEQEKDEQESSSSSSSSSSTQLKTGKKTAISNGNYIESAEVSAMATDAILEFRNQNAISVFSEEDSLSFRPITHFEYLYPSLQNYCPFVVAYLQKKNFKAPSPIQAECWPPLLMGRDAIGIAQTGSGKTLAFLIPALLKISRMGPKANKSTPSPRILIVSPTRELAAQSHEVAVEVGGPASVCIYGGIPKHQQKMDLRQGADVVVATPGRLLDLVEEGALSLQDVCYLVLDEADRMLDEGFEPAIRRIVAGCPTADKRQTVMFSATWPEEIRSLADTFLKKNVVRIVVGSTELAANHRVTQIVECIETPDKNKRLLNLLEKYHKSRTNRCLIFVLYKKEAVTLLTTLQSRGYNATAIHGDRSQYERTAALESFKTGECPLLIATDVAARGLDIPQVEYVINYSFPLTVEDYVHRIGRTGRGGATVLQEANQEVPQEIFKYNMVTKKKTSKLYGDFGPKADIAGKKATKITFE